MSAVDEIRDIMASIHRVFEQDSEEVQREWVRFTQKVDRKLEDALRHVIKKSLQVRAWGWELAVSAWRRGVAYVDGVEQRLEWLHVVVLTPALAGLRSHLSCCYAVKNLGSQTRPLTMRHMCPPRIANCRS